MTLNDFTRQVYYQKLVDSIKTIFPSLNKSTPTTNSITELKKLWQLGKNIHQGAARVPHGQKQIFYEHLTQDSLVNRTDLFNLTRFYNAFPQGLGQEKHFANLSWTHVRETLSLEDPKIRQFYLKLAAREGFSTRYLQLAIRHDLYHKEKMAGDKHPYGLIQQNKSFVYTYQARLLEVTDGDTLTLMADQGFYSHHQLTGRLRGINCSEMKGPQSKAAQESKLYVHEVLSALDFFVIKTHKTDSFGRYVIDVFYHPLYKDAGDIFEKGYFLNQQLLDLGMARLAPF